MGVKYYDDFGEITEGGTRLPGNRRYRPRPPPTPTPAPGRMHGATDSTWPMLLIVLGIGVLIFSFGFAVGHAWEPR